MIKFIPLGKYVALLIGAFLAGFNSSIAQTYVTIGGNDLSSASTPVNRSWNATPTLVSNYNCAEILYTNSELNIPAGNVSIDKLAFNKTGGSTSNSYQYNTTNVSIYMKTVSSTSLANSTYDLGSYTLVWSGNFPSGGAFGFKEVNFSTIFQYPNGANDHLSILVLNNSGIVPINNTTDRPEWACNTVNGSDIKSRFNSSFVSLPTFGNSSTTRPQIKLRYSICSAPPAILGPILGNSNSICAGGGDDYWVYNPEVGVTYTWSYSGNATITDNGNATTIGAGSAIQLTNVTTAGVLTVTPSNYCGTSPAQTINIDVIPVTNLTPPSYAPICEGQPVPPGCPVAAYVGNYSPALSNTMTTTYTFTPAPGYYGQCATGYSVTLVVIPNVTPTFLQVPPICSGQTIAPLPTTSDNGITGSWLPAINNTATTTYTFTPNSGQCAYPTTMTIVVNSLPSIPTVTANGSLTFCEGGNVVLTSSESIGNLWSTGETTQSITVNTSGDYFVTVSNLNGCSSNSLPTTVTVNPNPTIPIITPNGSLIFCDGENVVLTSSEATGNSWSNGASTQSITVNSTGNYSVTYTDVFGCSATSLPITVTVNPIVTPLFTPVSSICAGGALAPLTNPSNNGITGSWSPMLINNNTTTIYVFTPDVGFCATVQTLTVVVNPLPTTPTISASGSLTFCEGGNVVLTSSEPTGNLWSTGETTQSITVNTSGDYFVTVSNLNGCSANSLPTTVIVNPNPAIPTISANGPLTFCDGGNVVLTSSESNGNLWSNGTSSQVISVNFAGSYSVTFTDVNGCSATSAPITVTVYPLPAAPTISANGSLTFCEGGNVVLNSSEANGILWSNGSAFQSLTIYSSGDYSVEYTDVNGCSATSLPTTVTVNSTPITPTISANGPITFCAGESVVLTSSESNGNLWSNGSSAQSITVNSSGIYAVSFTDVNGCIANSSLIPVIVNSVPAMNVSMLTNDTITAFPIGQNYQWINCANDLPITGANDANYGVEVNGDYAVIVTNSDGCVDTSYCVAVNLPLLDPDAGLIIYPNPTTGNFSVSINTDQFVDVIEISFLNSVGNIISTQTAQAASGVQIINFANNQLQAGLYLIVVSDQNGNQLTGNVLIQ